MSPIPGTEQIPPEGDCGWAGTTAAVPGPNTAAAWSRGHPGSGAGLNRSHAGERGSLDRCGKTKEGPYRPDDQQHPVDGPDPAGRPGAAAAPDLARGPGRTATGLARAGWRNPVA